MSFANPFIAEPTCSEREIIVTTTVRYMCVCPCMHLSKFVQTITSTIVYGFQNNFTPLFSIMCKCSI